jgi:hypothetical protein
MTKAIYIAGPMSGYADWNYPAFHRAADLLRAKGYNVYNPAEKDKETFEDAEAQVAGDTALAIKKGTFDFREAYMWDLEKIVHGDGIYMLQGWEQSPGARGEHAAAVAMKKNYPEYEIIYE